MLVLTRKQDEEIMLGDDTKISILGVNGNQVRIGIHAPENVPILRKELYDKIQREKKEKAPAKQSFSFDITTF